MDFSYRGWVDSKVLGGKNFGNSGSAFVVLTIYFVFVLIRFVVSLLIQYPLIPTDELAYKSMALSYFSSGSFQDTARLGYSNNPVPNVIYPLFISPSFWFGQNFHTAIKLINALLMNSAIFPMYLLTREFLNKKNALILCLVVMTLPFFNFTNFVMVEASTFPLFLTCFYLAFKSISTRYLKYAAITGLFLGISFLSKPTALFSGVGLLISYFILVMFCVKKRLFSDVRPLMVSLIVTLCCSLISYLWLQHFLIGSDYFSLGVYKGFLSAKPSAMPPLGETIQMILAQFDTILLTYLIPFYVMILALIGVARTQVFKDMNKNSIFLIMVLSFFVAYLAGIVKFTIDIYSAEHFGRLHGRYYFMVFPLLILGLAIFLPFLRWELRDRMTLLVVGAVVILAGIFFFLPGYVSQGLTIVDNPDLAWYVLPNKYLIIPIASVFILTLLYYAITRRPSPVVFLWCLLCYSFIGNFGEIRASIYYDSLNTMEYKHCTEFIGCRIPKNNSRVVVVGSRIADRLFLAFWKPLNYVAVYDLPKGAKIERELVPTSADYLILFDEYELGLPVQSVVSRGRCSIVSFQSSNNVVQYGPANSK